MIESNKSTCINCSFLRVSYGDIDSPDFVFKYTCPYYGNVTPNDRCDRYKEMAGLVDEWYE